MPPSWRRRRGPWNEEGLPVIGQVGELVCVRPFPSMPLYFWGDADGSRYQSSYFGVWPSVWRHGDWLRIEADGSCSINGRSDATINRHGLRMGTAELYAAVERLPDVADTLVVDIEDDAGGSRLLMFVTPAGGRTLDADDEGSAWAKPSDLVSRRALSRTSTSEAPGILRTLSGKKLELPVKRLFQGWPIAKVINRDTIANPDLVPWYAEQAAQAKEGAPMKIGVVGAGLMGGEIALVFALGGSRRLAQRPGRGGAAARRRPPGRSAGEVGVARGIYSTETKAKVLAQVAPADRPRSIFRDAIWSARPCSGGGA
ncbi:hypothetical protein ACRAWD_22810 [Caulobacter segnis]